MTEDMWRQYLAAYYSYTERVDSQIGMLLDSLRKSGLEKETLVIFSSDHGDGMAAHQWLGKCSHYEESVRVPFIVSLPGRIRSGVVDSTHLVASCQDFYATALNYAGVPIPVNCSGRSIRVLAESGKSEGWRDQVVSEIWVAGENKEPWAVKGTGYGRMVRTAHYKYALYNEGTHPEVLLDMTQDRLEMNNLVYDPQHRTALMEHRNKLATWVRETRDNAFLKIMEKFDSAKG
jgi:arylsulfatase A-like enzyme